jgi:catalase (peroxidase I)
VGLEQAIKKAGSKAKVPFTAGRGDASQAQTDVRFLCSVRTNS